jgi:hypothetical protein
VGWGSANVPYIWGHFGYIRQWYVIFFHDYLRPHKTMNICEKAVGGITTYIFPKFELELWLNAIQKYRITV